MRLGVSFFSSRKAETRFGRNNQSGVFFCCVKIAKSFDHKNLKKWATTKCWRKIVCRWWIRIKFKLQVILNRTTEKRKKVSFRWLDVAIRLNDYNTWRIRQRRKDKKFGLWNSFVELISHRWVANRICCKVLQSDKVCSFIKKLICVCFASMVNFAQFNDRNFQRDFAINHARKQIHRLSELKT